MLVEFSIGNYRSFQEKATLSMVAANISSQPKSLDQNNVFSAGTDLKLVTSAALYGANASGKSNFITALGFARHLALTSSRETQVTEHISVEPFLLQAGKSEQPSFFETVFLIDGVQYRYGFEVSTVAVISEWLYKLGTLRELTLFERDGNGIKVNIRNFREGRGLEERTRPNALFLSVVAQFNGAIATEILTWFQRLNINTGVNAKDNIDMVAALHLFEDSPYRNSIEQLIKRLDVGIDGLDFERSPIAITIPQDFPKEIREIAEQYKLMFDVLSKDGSPDERPSVKTIHTVYDTRGQPTGRITFNIQEQESAGTQRIFALAQPLLRALTEGTVLVIDELDTRIHPNLAIELIWLFNSKETNPHHAQLIFTTHNTNLLSAQLFRRDQVWFLEKSRLGASDLYSLVEYRIDGKIVRNDASFEKDYIAGRYGAIPFIGDLKSLLGADIEQKIGP